MKAIHLYACCLLVCATIQFSISKQRQILVVTKPIQMNSDFSSIHDCHFYNVGEPQAYSMIDVRSRIGSEADTNSEPAGWGVDSWVPGKPCMHGHRHYCGHCGAEPDEVEVP